MNWYPCSEAFDDDMDVQGDAIVEAMMSSEAKLTVTVCSKCLTACCWNGIFYCQESKTAGTVEKTIEELTALDREHPSYWKVSAEKEP